MQTLFFIFSILVIHVTVMSITLYLHRSLTHRSVDFSKLASNVFQFWLWFACGMNYASLVEWVAVHRYHHAETDTENDPHNPKQKGPWKLFFFAFYYYRQSIAEMKTKVDDGGQNIFEKYSRNMPRVTWFNRVTSKIPSVSGLLVSALVYWSIWGWLGLVLWTIQTLWMPVVAGGVINVLGHLDSLGTQFYANENSSRSLAPTKNTPFSWIMVVVLNWSTGGEHLHNQHHHTAESCRFGDGTGLAFDVGYWEICQLEKLGFVENKRTPL